MRYNSSYINKCALLAILTIFSSSSSILQAKQQNVLLDANGKPLSNDVLLLLSTASGKFKGSRKPTEQQKKLKNKTKFSKGNKRKPNQKRSISNPILEQELLIAMKAGNIPRVKYLLKKGVKPTYKNLKGETPLGIAVSRGWASMVAELVEHGANLNEKGTRGVTLLHVASAKGLTDVAKLLVKLGLNPSKKTDKDWTSLHIAARYAHWKLVQYYLEQGVNPNVRNSDGKTALGLARHLRHMSIIKILSRVTTVRSLNYSKKSRKKRRKSKRK